MGRLTGGSREKTMLNRASLQFAGRFFHTKNTALRGGQQIVYPQYRDLPEHQGKRKKGENMLDYFCFRQINLKKSMAFIIQQLKPYFT